jgi:hypothetical protein
LNQHDFDKIKALDISCPTLLERQSAFGGAGFLKKSRDWQQAESAENLEF